MTLPANELVSHRLRSWGTRTVRRYEVGIAAVAAIVVITRLSAGGFVHPRPAATGLLGVVPFASAPARTQAPKPAALPSGGAPALPTSISSPAIGFGPSAAVPSEASGAAPEPHFGDVSLLATVPSPGAPTAVAVDRDLSLWVGTDNGAASPVLFHLSSGGDLLATYRLPGVTAGVTGIALAADGRVLMTTRAPAAVFAFTPSTQTTKQLTTIPDVRPCVPAVVTTNCDASVVDRPPQPTGLAFDATGNLFVTDAGQGSVWKVAAGADHAEQWLVEGNWASPVAPAGPTGIAFDGGGNAVVTVQGLLGDDVGRVFVIAADPRGSASTVHELAQTGSKSLPRAVALGVNGDVYVTLAGEGRVLALSPQGTEIGRAPGTSDPAIDTPSGLAFSGTELVVAAQTPGDPKAGKLYRVTAAEQGAPLRDGSKAK